MADTLRRMQGLATQSNLAIRGFTPQAPRSSSRCTPRCRIGLQADGTYHNLALFFDRVSKFPRIINMGGLRSRRRRHRSRQPRSWRNWWPRPSCCRRARAAGEAPAAAVREAAQFEVRTEAAMRQRIHESFGAVAAVARDGADRRRRRHPQGAGRTAGRRRPPAADRRRRRPRQGYTYDPAGRRDPFVSLVGRGSDPRSSAAARSGGLAASLINEITLKGIMRDRQGVRGDGPGTRQQDLHRAGRRPAARRTDQAITADAVVFSQDVNDPLSLIKQREVRKSSAGARRAADDRDDR